ncbi:ABC transporter substrate-binding protein [Gynuella sp.]|uniref:ABC transporter substrate-binding protein n=1 Tax=Gynuella sp. TaxID=2969146 RepID=UPI003D0F1693
MKLLTQNCARAALLSMVASMAMQVSAGEILIDSWRTDDKDLWEDVIIPAFNKHHPDIKVTFRPTNPPDYNATMDSRFKGGTAGDLIACRPFEVSLSWYHKGNLKSLQDQPGLDNFPVFAKAAWSDQGVPYCMPIASVLHGFFYNKEIFSELSLTVPKTEAEFFAVLEAIKKEGSYLPMALGSNDKWEDYEVAYAGVGPNYWHGETGRQDIINGQQKFTDQPFVDAWKYMAKWRPYLGKGYQAQTYSDSQTLFTLGRAAIYPGGSWEISGFNKAIEGEFEYSAFYPPVPKAGDQCYITDHVDIGMGINKHANNPADATVFLEWVGSAEFADLYTNKVSGFFSLSNHDITVKDPVAAEIKSWRDSCQSTVRLHSQIKADGILGALYDASAGVLNATRTPEQAAADVQAVLDSQ